MAWGYGTTVEDTEVYEGQPTDDTGGVNLSSGFKTEEEPYVSTSGGSALNRERLSNRISFYLDDDEFGLKYTDDQLSGKLGITQGGKINWGVDVSGKLFGQENLDEKWGPSAGVRAGILGQGISGPITPWGNLSTEVLPGLTFSAGAQKNPGMNFNLVGPSVSYGQQFKTPIGPLDFNLDKSYGGDWTGMLRYQKDW